MSTHSIAVLFAGALLIGCATESTTDESLSPAKSKSSALWGCEVDGQAVVCTAALPASANAEGAYACKADETLARCPSIAVDKVSGLRDLFARTGKEKVFSQMTWACLTTGKNQSHCTRDLGSLNRGLAGDSAGAGAGGGGQGPAGGGAGGAPQIPANCEPKSWEPYFAKLASASYKANGVDIDFPLDIFDANGSMMDSAMKGAMSGKTSTPGAPSCHDGEWQMRNQSWLDAVSVGCQSLNNAILAMCQQAAEYAPGTGKCNDTGSW